MENVEIQEIEELQDNVNEAPIEELVEDGEVENAN